VAVAATKVRPGARTFAGRARRPTPGLVGTSRSSATSRSTAVADGIVWPTPQEHERRWAFSNITASGNPMVRGYSSARSSCGLLSSLLGACSRGPGLGGGSGTRTATVRSSTCRLGRLARSAGCRWRCLTRVIGRGDVLPRQLVLLVGGITVIYAYFRSRCGAGLTAPRRTVKVQWRGLRRTRRVRWH